MIKKEINFFDLNGNKKVMTGFFHLNKLEAQKLGSKYDGLQETLEKMASEAEKNQDLNTINQGFDILTNAIGEIVLSSYGQPSSDGERFVKNKELTEAFEQSEAYPELVLELLSEPMKTFEFIKNVMPTRSLNPQQQELINQKMKDVEGKFKEVEDMMNEAERMVDNAGNNQNVNNVTATITNTVDDMKAPVNDSISSGWVRQ